MIKFIKYLHLRDVGGLELLIAFFPILIGYTVFGLPMGLLISLFLIVVYFFRKGQNHKLKNNPIMVFLMFMTIHDILVFAFLKSAQGVFINNLIGRVLYVMGILSVVNVLDYKKFRGSVNWVSLLCMAGMLYHFSLVLRGQSFSPLTLPFLPTQEESSRAFMEVDRPTSFFWEPQAYVTFMLVPLVFALEEKKYSWVAVITLTIFMSSSTTGLVIVFILIGFTLFIGREDKKNRKAYSNFLLIAVSVVMLFVLFRSGLFEQGLSRTEDKRMNAEDEIRLVQGPTVIGSMEIGEYVLGAPYANAYQFCIDKHITNRVFIYGENSMYMPTFWNVILLYGGVGLFFYLSIYWFYYKRNKPLRPYIACLVILLFTNPDFVGGSFCFQMCFIISHYKNLIVNENKIYIKA